VDHSRIPQFGVSATPLHSWRHIFFFEGLATMLIAVVCYFYMSTSPAMCAFLTPRQKYIATERLRREHLENPYEKTTVHDVKRGLLNVNNALCALGFFFNNISVQSLALFMPTILKALGWTSTNAQLLTVPPYVMAAAWSIFVSWLSDRYKKRGLFAIGHSLCAIVGYALLVNTNSAAVKYMAVFFCALGCYPLGPIFLSWGLNSLSPSLCLRPGLLTPPPRCRRPHHPRSLLRLYSLGRNAGRDHSNVDVHTRGRTGVPQRAHDKFGSAERGGRHLCGFNTVYPMGKQQASARGAGPSYCGVVGGGD
jgi:hypothetical protein